MTNELRDAMRTLIREIVREEMGALRAEIVAAQEAQGSPLPDHLTVREAGALLRCSTRTVHRYIAVRRLESKRVGGGKVLVSRASVERLLKVATR